MPSVKSTIPSPYDLQSQEEQAEARSAEAQATRQQQIDDMKWLMAHAAGRRIASRLFEFTGIRRTTFNPSGSVMSFNEGKRTVGLWFESELLTIVPDGYLKLLREYAHE